MSGLFYTYVRIEWRHLARNVVLQFVVRCMYVCMYGGKSSRLIDDLLLNITCVDVYVYMRACACNSFRVT